LLIYFPNMIFIGLAGMFVIMKFIEKKNKAKVNLLPACIMWLFVITYLMHILTNNGFISAGFNSAVVYGICGLSMLLPFFILKVKKRDSFLNMLYPCIAWSIMILIIFNFDIKRETALAGISISLMVFPIVIFVLNILFECFMIIVNKIKG